MSVVLARSNLSLSLTNAIILEQVVSLFMEIFSAERSVNLSASSYSHSNDGIEYYGRESSLFHSQDPRVEFSFFFMWKNVFF